MDFSAKKTVWFFFGRCTTTVLQLITILDTWTYEMDRGHCTDVIYKYNFMDYKAFDTTTSHQNKKVQMLVKT